MDEALKHYKMTRVKILTFWFGLILFIPLSSKAETNDSIVNKNVIKYNITAPLLWGSKNYIFEYERVLSPHRTMSISLGYRSFPKLLGIGKTDSAFIVRGHKNHGGLSASLDYRFYFKNENRYAAPRGIYFSPFASYFSNSFTNSFSTFYSDAFEVSLDTKVEMISVGFQLGYQFVFYDRFSLDICILGPSVSHYKVNMKLSGELNVPDIEFLKEVGELMQDNYPVTKIIFREFEMSGNGRTSKLFYGYRYYMTIGYAF